MRNSTRFPLWLATAASLLTGELTAQFFNDYDQPPHDYWTAEMSDPMSVLLRGEGAGDVELPAEDGLPLVLSLLEELEIPVESQVLVFSRTSLQRGAVSPSTPRAIYFNEDSYLGWMPGGRIEIASCDPSRGAVFFFQRKLDATEGPRFFRDRVCLQCHAGSATNFMPGLLARSVYPDARGRSLKAVESFERVGHGIPLRDRWGGWYVTGAPAGLSHMGNALAQRTNGKVLLGAGIGDREVERRIGSDRYPRAGSEILALLVMDHQVSMQYELMQASYVARQIAADFPGRSASLAELPDDTRGEVAQVAERVVAQLLFRDEAPIEAGPLDSGSPFATAFLSRAKRDKKGRSLRVLNLKTRMFEHRCSYMIHSSSFEGIAPLVKDLILARLREALRTDGGDPLSSHLTDGERRVIDEILTSTLPAYSASGTKTG